ncbi:beta-1,6-N-acetylglucosaminyltransferase [Rhizobium tropici]|uniref:beta-1,6-N-acetylglucosaminyltransferase n=1 Tax=Rhizobium tropici TaxID=398 RepID=UPI0002A7361D|nr:beta-1,6-N-acetylglucosaminyltransferase [Rhizobium tropici]AGB74959.1 putative family 14 glycosyl transferase [Rhizobium tropici CIAT 899]
MKLAFVILAHDNPDKVARLARVLAQNHTVCVHYDLNSSEASFLALKRELGSLADRVLWPRRVRVAWGEWSIVNATLNALEAISGSDSNFDYVHLMSGADYPVRPIEEFTDYLRQNRGREFIECVDLRSEQWVKGGLVHERYRYRHFFNWKKHGFLFDQSWQLQQRLGLERGFPSGHQPHMGSQWWTLTWSTIKLVLAAGRNGELASFFKTVWIPDEMFIQTIVASATEPKARSPILTLYQFSDSGVPIVYGDDHAEYLNRQPFFFARKISPHAKNVRDLLDAYIDGSQRGAVFEERAVGTRTDEYTRYVDYWGMPNKHFRLIGHVADSWWGDLLYLHQPVFIICGVSRSELRSVANVVRNFPDIRVHGALFDRRRIEFVDDLTIYGGYRDDDIALRDDRRLTFLYDAIKEGEKVGAYTAFILPWHTDGEIGERMKWSRHTVVH